MGKFEFKLPDIGEGVVEGEIVEWMVAVGDTVKEDDPILSVMTDKATVEIPAPCDGTVASIVGEAGDILPVGGVCIVFDVEGEGNASASSEPVAEEAPTEPVFEAAENGYFFRKMPDGSYDQTVYVQAEDGSYVPHQE